MAFTYNVHMLKKGKVQESMLNSVNAHKCRMQNFNSVQCT